MLFIQFCSRSLDLDSMTMSSAYSRQFSDGSLRVGGSRSPEFLRVSQMSFINKLKRTRLQLQFCLTPQFDLNEFVSPPDSSLV